MIWYLQGCLPCKVKAVYVTHQPWYLSGVWALLKPFLNEKMRMRMHVLGGSRRLLRVAFPGSSLPTQIGGEVRAGPCLQPPPGLQLVTPCPKLAQTPQRYLG